MRVFVAGTTLKTGCKYVHGLCLLQCCKKVATFLREQVLDEVVA